MQIAPESWPALSRLFDAAVDVDPPERERWLDALPPELAALRGPLRALLESHARVGQGGFLQRLPRIGPD